jgi:hypothetical protein
MQAEAAQNEVDGLAEELKAYETKVRERDAIQSWVDGSLNLLSTLEDVSTTLRDEPLDAEDFPIDQDTVLKELDVTGRQVKLDGYVRNRSAMPSLEAKLRSEQHRVQRDRSESSDEVAQYPWHYVLVVDIAKEQPAAEETKP